MPKVDVFDNFLELQAFPPAEGRLYYLASPYSDPDPVVKEVRYLLVTAFAAALFDHGYNLVEPIGSSHPTARMFELPTGYDYWKQRDRAMISHSDGVIVCQLPGWQTSVGVTDEVQYAIVNDIPVYMIDPYRVLKCLSRITDTVKI